MENGSIAFRMYFGTKTVAAAPMGANDARRYGAQITEETVRKNIGNDGYLVEYPDGYRSWSPKKVFDEAYRLSETKVDRMKIELADLNVRIKETADELYNPDRAFSHESDRWSLGKQLDAMREYADRLYERIDYATRPRELAFDSCDSAAESPAISAEKEEPQNSCRDNGGIPSVDTKEPTK